MKLILQFLKPHRTLCAATILLLIIDVTGALIISSFAAELLNLGVSGTSFDTLLHTGLMMAAASLISSLCAILGGYACATLSAQADALIRRAESGDMLRALALDSCATAAVEQLCDQIELELQRQFPGCFFPFRYSPGYGDLPLTLQSSLLALLDAPRQVGLCASASHILTPRKSVTAILGVADHPIQASVRSCLGCPAHDGCQYRKSGGHCGIS